MFKVSSLIICITKPFLILIFYKNVPNWHCPSTKNSTMQKQEDQQMRERQKSAAAL